MRSTLMDWRRLLGAGCLAMAVVGVPLCCFAQGPDTPDDSNQSEPAPKVDPAEKALRAADGLYNRGLFKQAADAYADFLSQFPNHKKLTQARYALGVCYFRLSEHEKAVEQLKQVLADPKAEKRDEVLTVLGHCELSLGHTDAALAAFDELLSKYPQSARAELATLNRAQTLYLSKKYPQAAKGCQDYLSKYTTGASRPDALYFLALSQRAMDQNAAAVQTLEQLTTKFPESPLIVDALLLSGQAQEAQGKLAGAIDAYKQMLSAAGETRKPDAHYSLGIALYKAQQYPAAIKEFSTLIADFPTSQYARPARLQLGLAQLADNKTNEARQTLAAVAQEDPQRGAEARYGLAQCDIADKQYAQARQTLEQLMQLQPPPANVAQIALDHAVCAMELSQYQPAADELEKLVAQYPQSPQIAEATYREAFCLHKLGKYDQSHQLCQQVAKMKAPELASANSELDAENLFLTAKYADAQKLFTALAANAKDDSRRLRFTFREGQCEYFAGAYAKAVTILQPLAAEPGAAKQPELQQLNLILGDALLQQGKYDAAIKPLQEYLQTAQAERPQAQYKLGIALLHQGDSQPARQAFEQAAQGPADSQWTQRALFERGQIDLKAKNYDQAGEAFGRVLASNAPAEVAGPAEYQLGWARFESKQYPQAAAAWKEMAAKYPNDKLAADAAFQQGVALRQAKQYDQALEALQAYVSAHPDGQYAIKARQLAAQCLKDLGKNDQAEQMLATLANEAKGADADSVLYDLAWSQRDAKQPAAAEATYQRLLKDHPDSKLAPAARTELAELLYNDKKYDQAAELLEAVLADKSADPKIVPLANYRLGWCYEKLNKPDKAAAIFAAYTIKGGGTDDMQASAMLQAGLAFASDQQYPKAEQLLAQMLQKYPNQKDAPVAMLKLAEVQARQSNFTASQRTYEQFIQQYPTSEFAYRAQFGIGWALENQKQYDQARKAYQKVIAATNGETAARAQFQIGETFLAEGKFEQGVVALLAVDDVYAYPKWSARALFEAGRAFEQLKKLDQAKKQYSEIISKYKDAPEAPMAQDRLKNIAGS